MDRLDGTLLLQLQRRAMSLGAAHAFDLAMQFMLPVLLVRFLPQEAFGGYRLLWLMIMTVMVIVPLSMPQSLYYFLPRANADEKRLHVHHTLLYLAGAGLLGGLFCSPWNPLLPDTMASLAGYGPLIPTLVVLVAITILLDVLPTVDERVHWQAGLIVGLSTLRTAMLGFGAWQAGSLTALIWLLLGLMGFKLLLLVGYVQRAHGLGGRWFDRQAFSAQFRHAAPLGLSSAFYGLRTQADQWVAALVFALENFATFSIAGVLAPMVNLCRQSVNNVFLPTMSRLQASGDLAGMIGLNANANATVARLTYPLFAIAFVFAEEIIGLVYTEAYVGAAPVMRIYIAGLAVFVIELSSLILLLRLGPFAMRMNLAALAASVTISWFAAQHFGLPGAAVGSTLAIYGDRVATLRRISAATSMPIAKLQDWGGLATQLFYAALSAAVAWGIVSHFLAGNGALMRLTVGASVVLATYAGLSLLGEQLQGRRLVAGGSDT
jgi:O-antigen/teichoic acid export membrane protein